jgi:hypothetical protein
VKLLGRGHTEFTEVPDQPTTPSGALIARGSEAAAQTQATADHGIARVDSAAPTIPLIMSDSAPAAAAIVSFAHTDSPFLVAAVATPATEVPSLAVPRGDLAKMSEMGSGDIARVVEALASLALDGPAYADHGWFVVPSASNEYGAAYVSADDFAFDLAAGEFSADWFWV